MKQVWKFPLNVAGSTFKVPVEHKFLHFNMQHGTPCVWVEVSGETDAHVERTVGIFGTGHDIPPEFDQYLGTIFIDGGTLVFHAYAISKVRDPLAEGVRRDDAGEISAITG